MHSIFQLELVKQNFQFNCILNKVLKREGVATTMCDFIKDRLIQMIAGRFESIAKFADVESTRVVGVVEIEDSLSVNKIRLDYFSAFFNFSRQNFTFHFTISLSSSFASSKLNFPVRSESIIATSERQISLEKL